MAPLLRAPKQFSKAAQTGMDILFENVSQILFLGQVYPVLLDLLLVGHGLADSTYAQIAQRRVAICE